MMFIYKHNRYIDGLLSDMIPLKKNIICLM